MNTLAVPDNDDDLIEITIDDMQMGQDPDGLPRTEPVAKAVVVKPEKAKAEPAPKPEPKFSEADLDAARRAAAEAQAQLAERTKELEAERSGRIVAEEKASKTTEMSWRSHWARVNSELSEAKGHISAVSADRDAARRDLRAAVEAQDADKMADANERIAQAAGLLSTLEQKRYEAEGAIERTKTDYAEYAAAAPKPEPKAEPKKDKEPEPSKPLGPDEWIESAKGTIGNDGADWLKENRQYVTDVKLHKKLLRFADEYLDDHGQHALKSPAFIEALNEKFNLKPKEAEVAEIEEPEAVVETKPQVRKAAPAAPVSRNTVPAQSSSKNGGIVLTQAQYNHAPEIYDNYEDFDPEVKAKFSAWSPTAARVQYDLHLKRGRKEKSHRFTS